MPKHKVGLIIGLIAAIILVFYAGARSEINLEKFQVFITNLGALAPIAFILAYTIGPVFFLPITPLSITAGVLFGPFLGTIYTVIGATLGACASFLVSRYLVKEWVDKKSPARVAIVQEKVKQQGWAFIAIARINPIFPFNAQNYIFGLTDITLGTFFLTSIVSLIPGSFAYVYLGYAGREILQGDPGSISRIATALIIFLLIIILMPYVIKKYQKIRPEN